MKQVSLLPVLAVCLSLNLTAAAIGETPGAPDVARLLVESSRIPGGFCVLLGGTGDLAVALSRAARYTVQILCPDGAALERARAVIRKEGAREKVSADLLTPGPLPHAGNLINLIVVDGALEATRDLPLREIRRVLTPLGAAFFGRAGSTTAGAGRVKELVASLVSRGFSDAGVVRGAGTWVKAVKPWPREIDEWNHYLHGADGNPVARDRVVAPPRRYQWISGPLWLRSHETDSSVRTLVTARGRLFYIGDDAPISLAGDHNLPDRWSLTARDAFNGVLLWKVPIADWGWRAWKHSWFSPRPGDIPLNVQKRLVAVDDRVYVTLGYRAPVSELDARTGEILRTHDGTDGTAEILYHAGTLILTVLEEGRARVTAIQGRSGKRLWISEKDYGGTTTDYVKWKTSQGSTPPARLDPTLNTATDGRVVTLLDGGNVVCLDFDTGKERWRTAFPIAETDRRAGGIDAGGSLWTGTLIVQDGVVVHASPGRLAGFSAESGKILWQQPKKYLGHLWYEWKDVFVIDGRVWTWSAELDRGKLEGTRQARGSTSTWPVSVNGYDLHSGKLDRQVPLGNIFKTHHHHRCYRNKATSRYILASRRGTEYVDLETGRHTIHNWVRGPCHVGMMPANGLQYAPPHPCVCYDDEKLNGMNALAPALSPDEGGADRPAPTAALAPGPALGEARGDPAGAGDWPTFRHDPLRSGAAATAVSPSPELLWRRRPGGKLTQPAVVGSRLFVPLVDERCLVALDTADGKPLWEFATLGRIDSPPTHHRGTVIFGSADGRVYCVRADDGRLVWRFRAAPRERRIGAFGQLESAWPVHGTVLVLDGIAYFAAGRSSHLDGGIYLHGVDAATGEPRHRTRLDGPRHGVQGLSQNHGLPMGALPDILQEAEGLIFMRDLVFNRALEKERVPPRRGIQRVTARGGLLDDSYFKRIPWSMGNRGGHARFIVHDRQAAYAVRMFDTLRGLDPKVYFTPGKEGYLLHATDRESGKSIWSRRTPVRVRAMVVTTGALFVAGSPDVVDPEDPLGAFEGRKGGVLSAVDRTSGRELWKRTLPSPPVFDGMAAARGRLYIAARDGSLSCFGDPGP